MLRNLALALASIILFFGLMEAALRLSGRVPTDAVRSPDLETLDSIPGLFEPGLDFVDRILPDLPYRVRINALGFRGEEFPAAKRPGTLRILCLGDSYTFGPYVEDHEAFPATLERILKQRASAPEPEVINAGANGFTIVDELEFLKRKALALEPDVVIVAFTQNDLQDLGRPRPQIEVMREHAKVKSMFVVGPIVKLLQRTALFNGMQRGAAWLKLRGRAAPSALSAETESLLWS
ncbi:MAG TPA: SGNH/GDSL hydrolase family protein, partial [Candidatus Polarisedimenticolia bacterium]|nr:SGNH/GDSL hydrolase family protein [Candidatus Polarisedimenticolia bacterium]